QSAFGRKIEPILSDGSASLAATAGACIVNGLRELIRRVRGEAAAETAVQLELRGVVYRIAGRGLVDETVRQQRFGQAGRHRVGDKLLVEPCAFGSQISDGPIDTAEQVVLEGGGPGLCITDAIVRIDGERVVRLLTGSKQKCILDV